MDSKTSGNPKVYYILYIQFNGHEVLFLDNKGNLDQIRFSSDFQGQNSGIRQAELLI